MAKKITRHPPGGYYATHIKGREDPFHLPGYTPRQKKIIRDKIRNQGPPSVNA